ncbi:MAG: transcription antitermination factor NusB [Ignavibacteriae bacterium]|nr:transcription antitermination factor NusB [Ignavibacteriota bacterium]MCB0724925.1 transcription antitermination factor NusB [Ignavibacteriota bacterium]MCB9242062.1 transcription antitermination factor NusB [Ignavibacteriales bacterium]
MVSKRREVRIKVMQVLYASEISKEPLDKIKNDLLTEIEDEDSINFSNNLIDKVSENIPMLDEFIVKKVENWEFERIAIVDKIILRMGIAELLFFPDIPPKVSINEAIDIAKDFCTKNSGKFVNGVLDAVLDELKKENKLEKSGRGLLDLKKKKEQHSGTK